MESLSHYPLLLFATIFAALWLAVGVGSWLRGRSAGAGEQRYEDLGVVLAATLTLLGLIIGFSFSMATSRYDQRKNLEEAEANAIGTELVRADLLPVTDADIVRKLLREYLDKRIQFYDESDAARRAELGVRTSQLQAELWKAVRGPALMQPNPVTALTISGMNDVLNSQGYSQAAYWNRIPAAAWYLLATIALCSNVLFGYQLRSRNVLSAVAVVLPFVVSIAFLLIADIDDPRHGLIHVRPQNLESLAKSLDPKSLD
ncbi:hypothetical protein ABIB73_006350 [Bradyrhizobium sp. F1.4.3]|uniref:bestrophin-like domain n=1 Tax=Bradyrhizobium sp. F1.4.3 TaxID=3156356 RepID=UPI00339606B1